MPDPAAPPLPAGIAPREPIVLPMLRNQLLDLAADPQADPDAFDRYHSFYALGSDVARLDGRFHADVRCLRLDRAMIHDRRLRSVSHGRPTDRVRRDDLSHFTVTLCLEGTMYGAGGEGFRRIRPGEIWLSDMSRPVQTRIEDARLLTVAVGRELVAAVVDHPANLNATILSARQSAPLARSLLGFVARGDSLSADEAGEAARSVSRLFSGILGAPSEIDSRRLDRLAMARRLIDAYIGEPGLDAELIATELRLSRSTVYRLFHDHGGVARYVQTRRLQQLKRMLSERGSDGSIADLAMLVGFVSESHVSRLFLDRYGRRPGAFRTEMQSLSDFAAGKAKMSDWLEAMQ